MSGINILKNLLLKQAVKESGQASGIMSIGDSVRKLVENKLQSYILSAAKKGIDLNKFNESQIKYMLEMNKPSNIAKMKLKKEKGIKSADVLDMKGRKLDKDKPIIGGTQPDLDKKADGGRIGLKEGRIAGFFKSLRPFSSKNKYTNQLEGILYGEMGLAEGLNLLSQSGLFAEGGRIGYKDGPEKPGRRTFMKAAAGLASILPFGIGKGVKMAAPVVAKAAEISGPALAKLVETVMSAGKLISLTGTRVKNMITKKKLGKVEVEENIEDGSYIIKKDGKEIYYKPGRQDESGGFDDDIIEVIEKRIQKAGGGGIGYMLGE